MKKIILASVAMLAAAFAAFSQDYPVAGADEKTPSKAEYFTWMSHLNEGPSEAQTYAELDFFQWLHDNYGMELDIFAFDAGFLDGRKFYGSTRSERFRKQYPHGIAPIRDRAAAFGASLGAWGGPDGMGDTAEEAAERMDMMVELARDYNFGLFKMDAVCGQLRQSKYDCFDRMMTRIRQERPDFVLLNHRLRLGPGMKHSTTYLLGGQETYIDVFMTNDTTAPHHRAGALARKAPDNLTRLTEDHGVCLSSCLDYWEDDLVLQAFGRELIMAPQIYANPWLLRDDELPTLAFIFNLHRDYRDILVDAVRMSEDSCGPEALSRGDEKTRFVTLRNLSWEPVKYTIRLDSETGLAAAGRVKVRQYHPYILDMGTHAWGSTIEVEVLPFRAALVKLTTAPEKDRVAVSGIPYQIVNDKAGSEYEVRLLGMPGQSYTARVEKGPVRFASAALDGKTNAALARGRSFRVKFPGEPLKNAFHRRLAFLQPTPAPADSVAIYDAMVFAADNNALEIRSLKRSGPTAIAQVQAARDALFGQRAFVTKDCWDRYMFDDDPSTCFSLSLREDITKLDATDFCVDAGQVVTLDKIEIDCPDEYSLIPFYFDEGAFAQFSADLVHWTTVNFLSDVHMTIDASKAGPFRYFRLGISPMRISGIRAWRGGQRVSTADWHATNLFRPFWKMCEAAGKAWKGATWSARVTLDEIPQGSYLCITMPGRYAADEAWAALKIDGQWQGCPDRAPSYNCNPYGWIVDYCGGNYTYYFPLNQDLKGKTLEVWAAAATNADIQPELWLSTYPIPFGSKSLCLKKAL